MWPERDMCQVELAVNIKGVGWVHWNTVTFARSFRLPDHDGVKVRCRPAASTDDTEWSEWVQPVDN